MNVSFLSASYTYKPLKNENKEYPKLTMSTNVAKLNLIQAYEICTSAFAFSVNIVIFFTKLLSTKLIFNHFDE